MNYSLYVFELKWDILILRALYVCQVYEGILLTTGSLSSLIIFNEMKKLGDFHYLFYLFVVMLVLLGIIYIYLMVIFLIYTILVAARALTKIKGMLK